MAGVFAPPKKYRMGSGGGSAKAPKVGGTMLGMAVASMFPKPASSSVSARPSSQAKRAFGGGSSTRMSGRAVMTAERTARRVPEAVVRITGRQHGGGHVLANFSYISRLGHGDEKELGLETSEGDVLRDGRDMQLLAKEWHEYEMDGDARRKGATSISMILSMPIGTDADRLKAAALDFAKEEFANRSWVASLHIDREHPHVHLTIARRDHDGRRFHPNRDDLFRYRQRFAEKLRGRGIEANATPARARGIDPKHEPIAAIKMREKGLVPRIDKSRIQRVERLRKQGVPDPVRAVLIARQATVRATYIRSVQELSASPSAADQMVAQSLQRFVATMPEPEPNSARAVRSARDIGDRAVVASPVMLTPEAAAAIVDRPETPLERMRKLHDRVMAPEVKPTVAPDVKAQPVGPRPDAAARIRAVVDRTRNGSSSTDDPDRAGSLSDRLRALTDKISEPSQSLDLTRTNEIIRQAEERDRAQRDGDRTPGKDGPGR
ncbi:relaxase/mobilization nuclease domain-containing protein [Sphingomonas sp. 2R-10]|uniref:relaxase/mobilization nuclease domain-containing protein n=1 Tax=Sphingomonas sp. 2R-10 TaxID=3045148 RepID=UPI0024BB8171|nr:relaxase/mobilization nuclease domain-containing protein [Sphingomonas sp. 2R-10]MDJ0276029.1 relaxase/mobilization nuclease domain-containing protein [Sphingomonas sp. 2R-10]